MHQLFKLKAGDIIDIIAPASRCTDENLNDIIDCLKNWNFQPRINHDIFGDDLLCASTDEVRFNNLEKALNDKDSRAVLCARGGYGSMRLIPFLDRMSRPERFKLFIGMSDITALHLYFLQQWQWPIIHGALNAKKFSSNSTIAFKRLLCGEAKDISFKGYALNEFAKKPYTIHSTVTGGNLAIVQTSLGTAWAIDASDKIIFLEEVGERGYRVDRMLEHLRQADVFKRAQAIVFGDFIGGNEPNGKSLLMPVLERFAASVAIPVLKINGVGHDVENHPIVMGSPSKLSLGDTPTLSFDCPT